MITQNFKNLMAMILQRCATAKGLLPVTAYNGTVYYLSENFNNSGAFPYAVTQTLALSESAVGICVGSGDRAESEDDYQLESQITGGLSAAITQTVGLDGYDNPYVSFDITITNSGSSNVVIREIGYKQNLYAATAKNGTNAGNRVCLLDRTVLFAPVTIPAGDIGVVRYTLITIRG